MSEEKNTKSVANTFDNIKEIKTLTGDGKLDEALKFGLDAIKKAKSLISVKEKEFNEIRKAEEAAAIEAQKEAETVSAVASEEPIAKTEQVAEEVKPKKTTKKKSEPKEEVSETPKTVEVEKTEEKVEKEPKTVEAETKEEVKVEVKPDNTPIKTGNPNIVIINGKRVYVPTPVKPKEYVNKEVDRRGPRGERGERGERRPYDGTQKREYSQGSQTGRTYNAPGSQDRMGRRKSLGGVASMDTMAYVPKDNTKSGGKKKTVEKNYEDKKAVNKKSLIKSQISVEDFDEDKTGYRKVRKAKDKKQEEISRIKVEKAVINKEIIPIKELSDKLGIQAVEITKKLFKEGIMKTINDSVDYDTAGYIAADLGIELELKLDKTAEDELLSGFTEDEGVDEKLVKRPPVVTVMGHVDHGKTSVLDRIRNTNVTAGEAGGITQHIGAYTVNVNGQAITFLDTPGHAAFTAMRARGAQITDIAVIVVAADDSVMPQTIEAINHAKAAGVAIIVAANKIDKPTANLEKVKKDLADQEVLIEEWGGDIAFVPVSAKTGEGMDALLETILLTAEMKELKANPDRMAKGAIVEAKLDKGKGPIATVLVQNGTLKVGDYLVAGSISGKVRAMMDDKGRNVKSAGPSMPVSILGLEEVPNAGDILYAVDQAKLSTLVANERKKKEREDMIKEQGKVSLDDLFSKIKTGDLKNLNIIVKADVQGSVEAVKQSLVKLSDEEVSVNVLHAAVGAITETDVDLADSTNSIIIGFNVRPDSKAKAVAEQAKVDIKLYRIIYEAIEDVQKAMKGMLEPKYEDVYYGKAEVRETFKITGVGTVAGCYVTDGKIVRNGKLRIYREDVMICEGNVLQLKRFKDDVKEVTQGFECGMSIENFNDIKIGDFIECYVSEESK